MLMMLLVVVLQSETLSKWAKGVIQRVRLDSVQHKGG